MKSLRLFFLLLISLACYATPLQQRQPPRGELPWKAAITPPGEPGEPLVVSGTVLDSDGARPVAGAVVYVYQTDAKGYYTPANATDSRNSRLHGWVKTNAAGKYEFRTVKPGPYPAGGVPAHIHFVVSADGFQDRVFEIVFEGDPQVGDQIRAQAQREYSMFSIRPLERDDQGALRCAQDIRLKRK